MKNFILFIVFLSIVSCKKETVKLIPDLMDNLEAYTELNPEFRLVRDSLIACAAGGQSQFLVDMERPISIFFYPEGDAIEFVYFETDSINVDPDDLSNFHRVALPDEPILNGYLRHFKREAVDEEIWSRVTFVKDGNLHVSNPIRIKFNNIPTEYTDDLTIDQTAPLSPIFEWEDGLVPENVIYFQIVIDQDDNLVSGTYTFEKLFQFYDLSNVVLNISPTTPTPILQTQREYSFVMMGVSIDNWVNLIVEGQFDTL